VEALWFFSYHAFVDCNGAWLDAVPIEPLVGFLRHPQMHCMQLPRSQQWQFVTTKAHLLPSWATEVWPGGDKSSSLAIFFDLGASLYNKGGGGASMKWFVDEYAARGIRFDRVFAWEAAAHSDSKIYSAMPNDIVDRISYYNLPVDAAVGAKHNPWRTLRAVARTVDFVVVKIDIDNSPIEEALIAELLDDGELATLIDELYFEHHVRDSPMWAYGWRANTVTNQTLVHSYNTFTRLREMGIRAHSWV